jgi:hypothetical protein
MGTFPQKTGDLRGADAPLKIYNPPLLERRGVGGELRTFINFSF